MENLIARGYVLVDEDGEFRKLDDAFDFALAATRLPVFDRNIDKLRFGTKEKDGKTFYTVQHFMKKPSSTERR
jgi:hypothetical protein